MRMLHTVCNMLIYVSNIKKKKWIQQFDRLSELWLFDMVQFIFICGTSWRERLKYKLKSDDENGELNQIRSIK